MQLGSSSPVPCRPRSAIWRNRRRAARDSAHPISSNAQCQTRILRRMHGACLRKLPSPADGIRVSCEGAVGVRLGRHRDESRRSPSRSARAGARAGHEIAAIWMRRCCSRRGGTSAWRRRSTRTPRSLWYGWLRTCMAKDRHTSPGINQSWSRVQVRYTTSMRTVCGMAMGGDYYTTYSITVVGQIPNPHVNPLSMAADRGECRQSQIAKLPVVLPHLPAVT